jgi:NAD(P)-dependent dehydrogenase (short-subunit alcohol dehydrogenase family)
MGKLEGKVAVITGGTAGIGLAAAKLFAAEGAHVFITGRRQKELDDAVKEIGDNVAGVQGDVSNLADLDRLYETVAANGRIDILFANAGLGEFARLEDVTEEHFDKIFGINVKGALFTVQKALPLLNDGGPSSSPVPSRASRELLRSRCTARARPLSGISCAAGPSNSKTAGSAPTSSAQARSRHFNRFRHRERIWEGSCRRFRWAAWASPAKWPRRRCSWPRTTRVSSRESNCSSTEAGPRSNTVIADLKHRGRRSSSWPPTQRTTQARAA